MGKIKLLFIIILILTTPLINWSNCHATTYISEDELYRMLYGRTKQEAKEENERIRQQIHEQMKEEQKEEDEGKFIQNVESREDFFEALCYQIKDYREEAYYDTNSTDIYYNLSDVMKESHAYYCSDNPIVSYCYTGYYLEDGISYTYGEKYDKDEYRYRIGVFLKYKYPREEFDAHMKYMNELAQTLKCDNDYDSVKAVHDYLTEHFDYDHDHKNYDDLQGVKDGVMVCNGYAMAAFNLLNNMNIPTRMVLGRAVGNNDEVDGHAWNIVKVDGQWYNMDVTWDDDGENGTAYRFFLKGSSEFSNHFPDEEYKKTAALAGDTSYALPVGTVDGQQPNEQLETGNSSSYNVMRDPDVLMFLVPIIGIFGICGFVTIIVAIKYIIGKI